ncbi:MAG: PTS sugar transporter subunit IIA [Spirochaetia bacterium]|jgi:PTS system nitrogen regulatory IIA component|nr:PTS sugar transporter subunit IIA [Spirochaetia bacterium]
MQEDEVLTLSEVAAYLRVAEKTVHRMLSRGEIPSVKVAGQWRFLRSVISEWLVSGMQKKVSDGIAKLIEADDFPVPLSRILKQELILTSLKGKNKEAVLRELAEHLVSEGVPGEWQDLYRLLLNREKMLSTAVGSGVAFPHPRNPGQNKSSRPIILLGIARDGIDFSSTDGELTKLFCLVYTDSDVVHLKLLSRLSRIFKNSDFVNELVECNSEQEVINKFLELEAGEK